MHWLLIILGTFILSVSVSNPFYRLIFEKKLKINILPKVFLRFLLFIIGFVVIFFGLYVESI